MSTTHTVWAAFSSWSVSVEKGGVGDKKCCKWQRPQRQHVLVLIIYETFNFVVLCSIADCIRRGPKPLQPQTQEVTTDIRPLHGPCAHGLLQSHKRSQLQVRQQRGRSGGGGVFVCVCISPWISKEAKARDALPHTEHIWAWKSRLFDQCECTVPCFSNTHFLPWHGTVGGGVLLQGWKNGSRVPGISLPLHFRRQFFSTLAVKYFQFLSNDVQMLCDCS